MSIIEAADRQEIWLAVDKRVIFRARDLVFKIFEQKAGGEREWRVDWPNRKLEWFEVARMWLTEI